MPRKRTLFAIFIALVLVGFIARGPIVSTFFEWYLKEYCRTCLGSRLTYKNIRHENDQWILDHPVLMTKKRLEEGGYRCQADRAVVNLSVSWLQRSLSLAVNVENPHLDVGKGAEEIRNVFKLSSKPFHMFALHTQFNVPQGTIFIHDFTQDHLVPVPLFFHIDLACKEKGHGCAALWLGEKLNENVQFLATFTENQSHGPQISFDLQNTECSLLQPILKGIWPEYQSLEIVKGNLSGNVVMTFPDHSPCYAEGKIFLKNFLANHTEMDSEFEISEFSLNFTPKEMEQDGLRSVRTIGNFNIFPSKIAFNKEGKRFWNVEGIAGSAAFDQEDNVSFSLSGNVDNHGKSRKLLMNGRGRFSGDGQSSFFINMDLSSANLHFSAQEFKDEWCRGELEFSGFGSEELDLARHLVAKSYPQWNDVHIHQGDIDAAILVYLKDFHLLEVKVERIAAHRLAFSFDPWDLYAGVESALGSLSFDLSKDDPLTTLNADLKISQGKLNLEGVDKASWQLSGIETNLTIHDGIFQRSLLKGTVAGLKAEIALDGTSAGPFVLFNFYGKVKDLAQALPDLLRKGLDKKFSEDDVAITANAKKTSKGLHFNGKIEVKAKDAANESILFGFILDRSSQTMWRRWPPHPFVMEYFPRAGFEAVHDMIPSIAAPLFSAYRHLVLRDLGFSGFTLKDGWFNAEKLPLNKYLSPFIFRNDQMQLSGNGKFLGKFDGQKLVVNYDAKEMVLESPDFAIEIKNLSGDNPSPENKLPATFLFDFDKKASLNSFVISNGTYFEKNSGLLYTEINSRMSMENTSAHFEDLTAFCNGLYFAGSADIDWSMPEEGVFVVDMHAHEMHGKVSQLQHLLSHLNKSLAFLKIPIEGNAALRKEGGHLHFSFYKEGYEVDSIIQGAMTDGVIAGQNLDLSLQELNLNFDYHHKGNKLEFTDIQGTLLVGKPSHVEEYTVTGDKVFFTDFARNEAEFDVWVGDKARDIIRLAGKTRYEINEYGIPLINFIFNRSLSHFGDVHPSIFQLAFKDWSQLELFRLTFDFQLKTLLDDLQRFSRTGLFFLSKGLLKELNEIQTAKGEFKADLNYDSSRSILNFRVDGEDVASGSREFEKFLLSGSKKGSTWSVDQLQLDNISLAFDLMKEGSLWNINFLGARMGDYLLIGMEGQYSDSDSHLEARINLFEANLSRLKDWALLNSWTFIHSIAGQLRSSGSLNAEFDKTMPLGMRLNMKLNGSLNQVKVNDMFFDDIKNMSFCFDTSRGFIASNVNTGLKSLEHSIKVGLFLQEAAFDVVNRELLIDGLHFNVPAENLAWTVQRLQENFPDKIAEPVADIIRSSKNHGSLQGFMHLSSSDAYSSLRFNFNDGLYRFMGQEHDLSGLVIDYDPYSLKVFTEYKYKKLRLRLDAHSAASDFDAGEIVLSDMSSGNMPTNPLTIHWRIHPQAGYYIQKMSGNLSGLTFDFARDSNQPLSPDSMHLVGKLDTNFRKADRLMEDRIAAGVTSLELGEGYSLAGQWSILKTNSKPLSDSIFFRGDLAGRDFEFNGYRFYNLSANLSYSPEAAYIRHLAVSDTCGSMQVEQIDFIHQGNGLWRTVIPSITLNEFRPSLLHSTTSATPRAARSLVIRTLNIKDVSGILGEKNTFKGNGQLTFANPPKKNLQPSFLAIPVELLTRIGLDLAVLTPVRGTIIFDIKDGKASLTRFKDVYSKGRLSKFYLPNNGNGSYVDFDGNLNLQVRMKQYNIVFKLAELFTVNVQGTLKKPTYTLQKQQKQEDVVNTK